MRFDLAISGCDIVTMNADMQVIAGGSIGIKGNAIAYIGKDRIKAKKMIDGKGKIAIPGLVNCHTHSPMTIFRGKAEDLPLETWLNKVIWPLEERLNATHVYHGALLACAEMALSGTTCFSDQYFFMESVAKACVEVGLKGVLAEGMVELFNEDRGRQLLTKGAKFAKEYNGWMGKIFTRLGPHSEYSCSLSFLSKVREMADKLRVGIHMHFAESASLIDGFIRRHNERPTEALSRIGFFKPDVLIAHAIHLTDREIHILREHGVKVSYNPASNMKVALGIPRVKEMIDSNITVGIGTDGPASNNTLDMLREMRIGALLQKIRYNDPAAISAQKILRMATIEGAKCLGLDSMTGSIEVGKRADIVLLSADRPGLNPHHNLYSTIVYSMSGSDVDTVISDGDVIVEQGRLTNIQIEKVLKKFRKSVLEVCGEGTEWLSM